MSHAAPQTPSADRVSASTPRTPVGTPPPPAPVRYAFALWVTAVAAGAFETVLAVGGMAADGSGSAPEIAVGLTVRLAVFTAALLAALRMRRGHNWARIALALGLGVAGTASMVAEPIRELVQGGSLGAALADAGAMDLAFGASRALHVAAVLGAVVLMFRPEAGDYFRNRVRRARRAGSVSSTLRP